MGYYSEKALELEARGARTYDWNTPPKIELLRQQVGELQDQLAEMDDIRPHDPLDPLYDLYFYEDYITHYNENPHTVQGLLRGIREIETRILEEEAKKNYTIFYFTAMMTGTDQDGQCVLLDAFEPPVCNWLTIAA